MWQKPSLLRLKPKCTPAVGGTQIEEGQLHEYIGKEGHLM